MAADGSGTITKIIPVWTQPGVPLPTPFTLSNDLPPPAPLPLTGSEAFIVYLNDIPASTTVGDALSIGVSSWNGRTGAVDLTLEDVTAVGGAPIYSPIFTGDPQAPTPAAGDASASIATTAFVTAAVDGTFQDFLPITGGTLAGPGNLTVNGLMTAASGYFVAAGTPGSNNGLVIQVNNLSRWTVYSDNTNELGANSGSNFAITAYNDAGSPLNSPITIQRSTGVVTNATGLVVSGGMSVTNLANFSGPTTLNGTTRGVTPTAGDSSTLLATTAFVTNAIAAVPAGVTSFNGRTGAITLTTGDITGAGGATAAQLGNYLALTGGTLTGATYGLTAAPGTNNTQLATTAFVTNAINSIPPGGVTSFNGRTGAITLTQADITAAGGGTVTSVGLTMPTAIFGVVGSPVTSAGTITVVANNQTAGTVLAAPAAANGQPTFRALTATDIPSLSSLYLPLTGGTVTGPVLGITAAPGDNSTTFATTAFVDAAIAAGGGGGGGASVSVGATPPANPTLGNLWFDSVGLQTYIWYTDPTSSQWVPVINEGAAEGAAGIPEAPTDGQIYGRQGSNTSWQPVLPLTGGAITGPLTAPTPAAADNSTNVATTAYVRTSFVALTGGTMSGQLTITGTAGLRLTKAAGTNNNNLIGATAGSLRWYVVLGDSVAESGSNAGSNFDINNYSDTGTLIGTALNINRATSVATFSGGVDVTGVFPSTADAGHANFGIVVDASVAGSGAYIALNGSSSAAGGAAGIASSRGISRRWMMYLGNGGAETGSNAGADFVIQNFNDSGTQIGAPFTINRASGNVTMTNQLTVGAYITITGVSGNNSNLYISKYSGAGYANYIHGQTNGSERWLLGFGDGGSETGGNAGSNYTLYRYADNGTTQIDAPFAINRASGVASFSQPIINGSDVRQKREITPISDALALVKQLAGVSYERISRPGKRELGLLAQDVRVIVPEAVEECVEAEEGQYKVGTSDSPLLGVSYPQFTALLIEAVKQLAAKVEALEAANAAV